MGVTYIFLMLLVIDVILGPLLGLLVYKEGALLHKDLKIRFTLSDSGLSDNLGMRSA